MVSWMSMACAMATLVPTPSVEVASSGRGHAAARETSYRPAKPPTPPSTSALGVATEAFISSTARSPASTSTPAQA